MGYKMEGFGSKSGLPKIQGEDEKDLARKDKKILKQQHGKKAVFAGYLLDQKRNEAYCDAYFTISTSRCSRLSKHL